ncbi:hypothetical protein K1719_023286 [Acacia pycnantha]|nr:hypothetical protein K1719_023286 [Acacia pycnantha]
MGSHLELITQTQFDPSTTWDSLPPVLCNLGKVNGSETAFISLLKCENELCFKYTRLLKEKGTGTPGGDVAGDNDDHNAAD